MSSKACYSAYIGGEQPGDIEMLDLREWASVYRTWLARKETLEVMLASESTLRRDWDRPEEDEAWSEL